MVQGLRLRQDAGVEEVGHLIQERLHPADVAVVAVEVQLDDQGVGLPLVQHPRRLQGAYLGLQGPFVIADFVDAPSVGYQEMVVGAQPLEDPEQVVLLDFTWNTVRSEALPRAASLALLEEAAKSWTSAT